MYALPERLCSPVNDLINEDAYVGRRLPRMRGCSATAYTAGLKVGQGTKVGQALQLVSSVCPKSRRMRKGPRKPTGPWSALTSKQRRSNDRQCP